MFARILKNLATKAEVLYSHVLKINNNHLPAGTSEGGQFTSGGKVDAAGDTPSLANNPEKWKFYTEDYANSKKTPEVAEQKNGYRLEYFKPNPKDADEHGGDILAVNDKNEVVGSTFISLDNGRMEGAVEVRPDSRRQGIASEMYILGEKVTGKRFVPAETHTARAEAFWNQPNRKFGAVLKFNPYHDQKGRFATHGSATFISLSGKQYASILNPKNSSKNLTAAAAQLAKLQTAAYNLGKNVRATSSKDLIPGAADAAQLAASGADVYGKNANVPSENLRQSIANAFAKSGLDIQTKQAMKLPLTTEEQKLVGEALNAKKLAASAKGAVSEQVAAGKEYSKAYVKTMMAYDKAKYQHKDAEAEQLSQKMKDLRDKFLAAGGTDQQFGKLAQAGFAKKEAKQEEIKAKLVAAATEYYKAQFVVNGTGDIADAALAQKAKDAANKLWMPNKYFLGEVGSAFTTPAKEKFDEWKSTLEAQHAQVKELYANGTISKSSYDFNIASMKSKGFTDQALSKLATPEAQAATTKLLAEQKDAQLKKDQEKLDLTAKLKDTQIDYHAAVLNSNDPGKVAELKTKQIAAQDAAEASGYYKAGEIASLKQGVTDSVTKAHEVMVTTATKEVTDASHALAMARLNGDRTAAIEQAGQLHTTVGQYQDYLSKEQLIAAKAAGDASAKKTFEASKAFKDAVGDPNKTISAYDAAAETFKYPSGDEGFAKQQDAQIAKLPYQTVDVLKSYTGSSYTDINKLAGQYGADKMAGKNPEPLSDYMKTQVQNMDAAFSHITLGQNVALRRNMPQKYFWDQLGIPLDKLDSMSADDLNALKGRVYKETAFGSASMNKNFKGMFSKEGDKTGRMVLRIRASAGINAVRAASLSNHDAEEEVIMGRGTTYVIRSVKKLDDYYYRYEVEVDAIGTYPDRL